MYEAQPIYFKPSDSMAGVVNATGNVSPVAEANIANDPDAAKVVFNCMYDFLPV